MENLAVKKYFYLSDPSGLLFKGNGTGLLTSLVAMSKVLPDQSFSLPVYPSLIYLFGIICAFAVHWITTTLNNDMNMRERRDNMIEQLELLKLKSQEDPQLFTLWEQGQKSIEQAQAILLTAKQTVVFKMVQSVAYGMSALSFCIATLSAIYIVA